MTCLKRCCVVATHHTDRTKSISRQGETPPRLRVCTHDTREFIIWDPPRPGPQSSEPEADPQAASRCVAIFWRSSFLTYGLLTRYGFFCSLLDKYLNLGGIPIITGFQGVSNDFRITTIGRSGSDATAIMLAKFIKADECIIYTDVDGVYTTDPRQYEKAKISIFKIFL